MIALTLSILASSLIFVLFKLFKTYEIDTFQAIVFNYFAAFFCGITFFGYEWNDRVLIDLSWLPSVLICSFLFISLFVLMGISSQNNGIASTSVAVKMSMALSIGAMILIYQETVNLFKIFGILLAIIGVLLVSLEKKDTTKNTSSWMLGILFLGSAFLDLTLNISQGFLLGSLTPSLFSAFGFGLAGAFGSFVLVFQYIKKIRQFSWKHVLAGILLGIPNFFSIYLLLVAYDSANLSDSIVVTIINISVVCLSTIFGFFLFREKLTTQKWLGILVVVAAIFLISRS
jgi:drug/metabolite transporter (DMT)-like permease